MRRLTARSRVVTAVLVALGSISFFVGAFWYRKPGLGELEFWTLVGGVDQQPRRAQTACIPSR